MSHSRIIAVWGSIVLSFFSVTQLFSQASFIPNKGQWEKDILYRANLSSGYIWISNDKIVFKFWDIHSSAELHRSQKDSNVINYYSFAIKFHGANFSEILETGTQSQEYYNYILGKDRNKWKSGLRFDLICSLVKDIPLIQIGSCVIKA